MNTHDEVLVQGTVTSPRASIIFVCLASPAIFAAVALVINLIMGPDELPAELEGTTPWFAAAAGLLFIMTIAVYLAGREPLELRRRGELLELSIAGKEIARGMFSAWYAYEWHMVSRYARMRKLTLGLFAEGRCVAAFTGWLGNIQQTPQGWPEGPLWLPCDEHTYHCRLHRPRLLTDLVQAIENNRNAM
jgi:hypothetical protein